MSDLLLFAALCLGADPAEAVAVEFRPGANKTLEPRYSPHGSQLALTPKEHPGVKGFDHLETRIKLGPDRAKAAGRLVVLARTAKGEPYDLLFVDANGDGSAADETPQTTKPSVTRGNHWSNFSATLAVDHGNGIREDYPVNFWAVVEKPDETPKVVRYSRRGYLTGTAKLNGADYDLVLSDADNDAVLRGGDWWELRAAGVAPAKGAIGSRPVGDFHWAGKAAWRLELTGTNGRAGKLIRYDPGVTPEEDAIKRDRMHEDRAAPRAATPVPFRKDAKAAIAEVAGKKPYFLKFEADWCMGCKEMDVLVFKARDVAAAAEGVVCIKVDVDEHKDLREKYAAKGLPAGILFDAEGKEVARHTGYSGVKDMTKFFATLKK